MQTKVTWIVGLSAVGLVVAYFIGVPINQFGLYGFAGAVIGLVIAFLIVP
jgi:hypothetical protein